MISVTSLFFICICCLCRKREFKQQVEGINIPSFDQGNQQSMLNLQETNVQNNRPMTMGPYNIPGNQVPTYGAGNSVLGSMVSVNNNCTIPVHNVVTRKF